MRETLTRLCVALAVLALVAIPNAAAEEQRGAPQRGAPAQGQEIVPEDLEDYDELIGPIMTEAEEDAWGDLRSDEQRQAFIDQFWADRDPTPGTEDNEVRAIFMRRAARAMRMARERNEPGYATDRGRVLIVYGLPNEQETRGGTPGGGVGGGGGGGGDPVGGGGGGGGDSSLGAGSRGAGAGGPDIYWTYQHPPLERTLRFSPASRGSYSLRTRVDFSQEAFMESIQGELDLMLSGAGGAETAVGVPPTMGAPAGAAPVLPEVRIWMQMVRAGEMREDFGLEQRVAYFPAPDGTFTVVAFEVGKQGLSFTGESEAEQARLKVFGALLQGDPGAEDTVHQFSIPFTLASDSGDDAESSTLSFGATLPPGSYRLAWGVMDEATEQAATSDTIIDVPNFANTTLTITDPLVHRPPASQDASPMSPQSIYEGVRLGNMLLADDIDRVFQRDDTMELVFVALGWQPDPAAPGRPKLEVQYRILSGHTGSASIARLPVQSLSIHAIGQQIPLGQVSQIQAGESYRIEITVKDLIGGTEITREVPFSVAPAGTE